MLTVYDVPVTTEMIVVPAVTPLPVITKFAEREGPETMAVTVRVVAVIDPVNTVAGRPYLPEGQGVWVALVEPKGQ